MRMRCKMAQVWIRGQEERWKLNWRIGVRMKDLCIRCWDISKLTDKMMKRNMKVVVVLCGCVCVYRWGWKDNSRGVLKRNQQNRDFPGCLWLRLRASNAGPVHGFDPRLGTKIPHAKWCGQVKKKKKNVNQQNKPTWDEKSMRKVVWYRKTEKRDRPWSS